MSPALHAVFVAWLLACASTDDAASRPHPPRDPWTARAAPGEPDAVARGRAVFASCASCHLVDASGRADGSVPRLAGQPAEVLVDKLTRLRDGRLRLPVMEAFARSLSPQEIADVAAFLARLPTQAETSGASSPHAAGCVACHGEAGLPGLPQLCGQHAPYLVRRAQDFVAGTRAVRPGFAPLVATMVDALAALPEGGLEALADDLAAGRCAPPPVTP
ncbi:MAG: c-type cytochrome [Alphaproteobacteria bacterium]|nr:c-type cytochrome [Alphaproteobacteria bacterium]